MQVENDYDEEVYNGEIGSVEDVDAAAGELTARFDGRLVIYGFDELDMLVPAYALTIHKSQGSEYQAVVVPVMTQHYAMLQRNPLHRHHQRQETRRVGRPEEGSCHRGPRWSKLSEWLTPRRSSASLFLMRFPGGTPPRCPLVPRPPAGSSQDHPCWAASLLVRPPPAAADREWARPGLSGAPNRGCLVFDRDQEIRS
jgi:hypothetical protein